MTTCPALPSVNIEHQIHPPLPIGHLHFMPAAMKQLPSTVNDHTATTLDDNPFGLISPQITSPASKSSNRSAQIKRSLVACIYRHLHLPPRKIKPREKNVQHVSTHSAQWDHSLRAQKRTRLRTKRHFITRTNSSNRLST